VSLIGGGGCLSRQDNKILTPNQRHIQTKVPAIQAMQVEDELAPGMVEYVPAKASGEEWVSRFEDKRLCEHVKAREDGGGNTFHHRMLVPT
jgi:hypothetical protein